MFISQLTSAVAIAGLLPFTSSSALTDVTSASIELGNTIDRPWLGYGLNIEPEPGGGSNPSVYTEEQAALDDKRIDAIKPQVARVTWLTTGFDPTGEVGVYDWNTTWARNEFRALDSLKERNVPIMVGWWDTPWDATSSDHSTVVADFLDYLIRTKGYTNIYAWNGINEPNHRDPTTYTRWRTEVANIKAAIDQRGLQVEVLGPGTQDVSASQDWLEAAASDISKDLSGYSIHLYPTGATSITSGDVGKQVASFVSAVDKIDPDIKPFYVEELGNKYGYDSQNDAQPHAVEYSYGLDMADIGIQVARAGASAPMAWRLADLGSPKLWGMYDGSEGDTALRPWAYSWTMLSRAFPRGVDLFAPADASGVRTLVGRSGTGVDTQWSVAIVNRSGSQVSSAIHLPEAGEAVFTRYSYFDGSRATDGDGFPASDGTVAANGNDEVTVVVPANAMVVLTNIQS